VKTRRSVVGSLLALVLFAAVPWFVANSYVMHIFILAMIYLVVVAGWDLIMGFGGVFSFGQIAFFVVGAYAAGILASQHGVSPWLAMPAGGLVAAVVAAVLALPVLRVRGDYVALITYALALLLPTIIVQGAFLGTGGSAGLVGMPTLHFFGIAFDPMTKGPWYYVALGIAAFSVFVIYFVIMRSKFGLALTALRDADGFAQSLGVNQYRTKVMLFAVSGFFTGLAGGYYAFYTAAVSQRLLGLDFFLLIMVMLTVGGMARYPGAIVGTFIFAFASEYLKVAAEWRMIILGSVIIVAILILPGGLVELPESIGAFVKRRRRGQPPGPGAAPAD
jgi:branched-chain amino acid transport system permease protein